MFSTNQPERVFKRYYSWAMIHFIILLNGFGHQLTN